MESKAIKPVLRACGAPKPVSSDMRKIAAFSLTAVHDVVVSANNVARPFLNTTVGQVQGKLVEQKYPNLLTEECKVPKPDKVLKYGTAGERCREPIKV